MKQLREAKVDHVEFVTFVSGGQNFCIEISNIREIRRWSPVAILPHSPDYVLGIINLRGMVIPIYDLALRLELGNTRQAERTVIIIVATGDQTVGLLVDSVAEILNVNRENIQSAPIYEDNKSSEVIQGLISIEDDITRILDINDLISTSKIPRKTEEENLSVGSSL